MKPLKPGALAVLGPFAALGLVAALLPAGVASASTKKAPPKTATTPAPLAPAASGQIAYISGGTLEVRNPETGQTTVKVTSKTRVTATVAVTLKAVKKGACISASGTKAKNGALDATSITLTAGPSGNCLLRAQARRAFPGSGRGSFRPPASTRTARPRFRLPTGFTTALGKVISVSGEEIALEGELVSFQAPQGARPKASATAAVKPKEVLVVVSAKTKYLRTGPASLASLKVGECATAFGSTNNIGAVTATRLSVSPSSSSGCGFGSFAGFGPFGNAGAGA